MDILLGSVGVTRKQLANADHLKTGKVLGFGMVEDDLVVVVSDDITEKEKNDLVVALRACPEVNSEKAKREQDHSKALDKIATAAGLSKDEKEALKEKERANVKKIR